MRLIDELEPKVLEIQRLAREVFCDQELRPYGLHFDGTGAVALDWASPMNQPGWTGQNWDEDAQQRLIAVVVDKVSRLNDDVEHLLARFRRYYDLDTAKIATVIDTWGGRAQAIAPTEAPTIHHRIGFADSFWVGRVDGLIDEKDWSADGEQWTGQAARAFDTDFLQPFHEAALRQQAYATELALTSQVFHDYVIAIQKALLQVADDCIDALGGRDVPLTGPEKTWQAVTGLAAASILVGSLAFFPAIAIVAGVVSLGTSIASLVGGLVFETKMPRTVSVSGDTVWEIIQSAWDTLSSVVEAYSEGDKDLDTALAQDMTSEQAFASPRLTVEPPAVATRPAFSRLTVQSVPGVPLAQDTVVVSIVDLYRAGKVNLAGAAAQYTETAQQLATCTMPSSFAGIFPSAVTAYDDARDRFGRILAQTRESLEAAADALISAAQTYQMNDEQAAEAIRQMSQIRTPDPGPVAGRVGGV